MTFIYILMGALVVLALVGFAVASQRENEPVAARRAWVAAGGASLGWLVMGLVLHPWLPVVTGVLLGLGLAVLLAMWLPWGRSEPLRTRPDLLERFDERHVIFGRMSLEPQTEQHGVYYRTLNPGAAQVDEHLRSMPQLGEPGSQCYHPLDTPYSSAVFRYIEDFRHLVEPAVNEASEVEIPPEEAARRVKGFARELGAADVRITRLQSHHLYSHAGRRLENWGEPIPAKHKYAVVVSVEMRHEMVQSAPSNVSVTETSVQYLNGATIAIALSYYISQLGFEARAHIDGNYQVLCTALAHDAGIGELGRLGLIVTPRHGPRVRLAAVTTDIPLQEDPPVNFGVQHFCRICKKCADNCPSGSIARGDKKQVRGVEKWQSNMESCFRYWLKTGTDCGLCLTVCPYAKPDTWMHRLVRYAASRNPLSRHVALRMDDLFYSRRPRHSRSPDWFAPHASDRRSNGRG
jgi:reductive dehalogenase